MRSAARGITDVVSAILTLGRTKTTGAIPRAAIHKIFWKMQPEESLLSRVRFSITGDVCFSRDIDTAIDQLIARGTLRMEKDSSILQGDIPTLRSLSHARHTHHELLTASRNFYKRLGEWKASTTNELAEIEMNA